MKRMFGNMVKEKHIEFFIKPNDPRSGVYSIPNKFCYLPFIHPTINGDDCKLSDFSIFTPNDCTYPFQYRSTEGVVRKITLRYKTKFHVSELVHDLFVALRHSTDHILYEGIKDLLKYYFDKKYKFLLCDVPIVNNARRYLNRDKQAFEAI